MLGFVIVRSESKCVKLLILTNPKMQSGKRNPDTGLAFYNVFYKEEY